MRGSVIAALCCFTPLLVIALTCGTLRAEEADGKETQGSVNILLITSGCCHDYDFQTKAMQLAMEKRGVEAVWTVVHEGGTGTSAQIDFYDGRMQNWQYGILGSGTALAASYLVNAVLLKRNQ